jgi:hypothetical protein
MTIYRLNLDHDYFRWTAGLPDWLVEVVPNYEAAAKEAQADDYAAAPDHVPASWDDESDEQKELYLQRAKRAVDAALQEDTE